MESQQVVNIRMLSKSECEKLFAHEIYNEFCMMNPASRLFKVDGAIFHFKRDVEWEETITGWWIFKRKTRSVKSIGPIYINTDTGYAFTPDDYENSRPTLKTILDDHIKS